MGGNTRGTRQDLPVTLYAARSVTECQSLSVNLTTDISRTCMYPESCGTLTKPFNIALRAAIEPMKLQYFSDTDTLQIEFQAGDITETRDLDDNTLLEMDDTGNVCALTFEHASKRTDVRQLAIEGIAA